MYQEIKHFFLKLIPRKVLFRYEYPFRYLYYLLYIGNGFKCNICHKTISSFVKINNDNRLCPRCGSFQRVRRLWQILNDYELLKDNYKILDFSPSRSIYRVMKKGNYSYLSSDLSGDFLSDISYDIQHIGSVNECFDLIICYHILEHIDDDIMAMKELWRVLKKDRHCLIQTPFKSGDIFEDDTIKTPEKREQFFGQSDHVRIYSINGLRNRLEDVGFKVETKNFTEKFDNVHGFSENETVLICYKPK